MLEALKKELGIDVGETTEDREFSLEVARCFGACGLAPVIMIDDDVHHRVKPARINEILAQYAPERGSRRGRRKGAPDHGRQDHEPRPTCWRMAEKAKEDIDLRRGPRRSQVTVHMGTCGIAAGARDVVVAFMTEIADAKLDNVDRPPVRLRRPLRDGADGDRAVRRRAPCTATASWTTDKVHDDRADAPRGRHPGRRHTSSSRVSSAVERRNVWLR